MSENKDQFVPATPKAEPVSHPKPADPAAVAAAPNSTSGMAIAGLVCAFIFPLFGLIFSIIGLNQTKDNKRGGRVLAIIGTVISSISLLIGLLWFVLVIVAIANSDSISDNSTSTYSDISSLNDKNTPSTKAKLNQAARDGKFEFTVKSVKCGEVTVGDQYYSVTAQGEYCMVSVKVTNIGDEPQGIYSSSQYLYNNEGQKFSSDSSATSRVQTDNDLWWSDINPGNSVEGIIVYDVPKGMTPASVELHDSFFSDGILVDLK